MPIKPEIAAHARRGLIVTDAAPDRALVLIRWEILRRERRERLAALSAQVAA